MTTDRIFRCYYRPLCLYALHYLRELDAAEDVVQDCFVRLLEHQPVASEKAWLYAAVRNACIDRLRHAQTDPQTTSLDVQPTDLDGAISDEEAQERSLHEAQLWTAIDSLPDRCRQVFLMAKRDGKTYHEIALELNISERTVEHQMSKALRVLRGKVDTFFYTFLLVA